MIISRESSMLEAQKTLVMLVNKKNKDKLVHYFRERKTLVYALLYIGGKYRKILIGKQVNEI